MRWVWRDGRPEPGAPPAPGGSVHGAFTTVGCEEGRPLLWPRHAARLARDLEALGAATGLRLPAEDELAALLAGSGLRGPARLRVVAWRDATGWRTGAEAAALPACGPRLAPLALEPVRWAAPPRAGHKILARRAWDLAAAAARAAGADDALLLDPAGRALETTVANLWAVLGDTVVTPPAPARGLPGVMRGWLLERLPAAGLEPVERDLSLEELLAAREVWVSNALVGVRRVRRVGRRSWDRWPAHRRLAGLALPAPGWPR